MKFSPIPKKGIVTIDMEQLALILILDFQLNQTAFPPRIVTLVHSPELKIYSKSFSEKILVAWETEISSQAHSSKMMMISFSFGRRRQNNNNNNNTNSNSNRRRDPFSSMFNAGFGFGMGNDNDFFSNPFGNFRDMSGMNMNFGMGGFGGPSQSVSTSTIIKNGKKVTVTKTTITNADGTSQTEVQETIIDEGGNRRDNRYIEGQAQTNGRTMEIDNGRNDYGSREIFREPVRGIEPKFDKKSSFEARNGEMNRNSYNDGFKMTNEKRYDSKDFDDGKRNGSKDNLGFKNPTPKKR